MFGAEGALQLRPGKSLYSRACALLRKYLFRGLLPCRLSAMFSPAPHHITPRSLTANHRPRFPPTFGGGAARRGPTPAGPPHRGPSRCPGPARPCRRPRPSLSLPLPAGGRAGCSGCGQGNRHMPRQTSAPSNGKRERADPSGVGPMASAILLDTVT